MATKKYELTKEYFFHGEFWHQLDDNKGLWYESNIHRTMV